MVWKKKKKQQYNKYITSAIFQWFVVAASKQEHVAIVSVLSAIAGIGPELFISAFF